MRDGDGHCYSPTKAGKPRVNWCKSYPTNPAIPISILPYTHGFIYRAQPSLSVRRIEPLSRSGWRFLLKRQRRANILPPPWLLPSSLERILKQETEVNPQTFSLLLRTLIWSEPRIRIRIRFLRPFYPLLRLMRLRITSPITGWSWARFCLMRVVTISRNRAGCGRSCGT